MYELEFEDVWGSLVGIDRYGAIPLYTGWLALTFKEPRGDVDGCGVWILMWLVAKRPIGIARVLGLPEVIWFFAKKKTGTTLVKSWQVPASAKGRFALFVAPDTFQIRCPEMRQVGFCSDRWMEYDMIWYHKCAATLMCEYHIYILLADAISQRADFNRPVHNVYV